MPPQIPFLDLARDVAEVSVAARRRIGAVLERASFIQGPELQGFESEFAAWLGARRVIGVGSGTDALALALTALGIRPGDEVVTVANTCAPTALAIVAAGAQVRLVDCDGATLMMSTSALEGTISARTRAIVPVHLYGSAADVARIHAIASVVGAVVVEDCAHAIGTKLVDGRAGTLGHAAAFSFYPTKNLGAYGDAGAIATSDERVADRATALRHQGQRVRDVTEELGRNARLDEIQAAVLRVKLLSVDRWNARRRAIAGFYTERFAALGLRMPTRPAYLVEHAHHLFPVLVPDRARFRERLAADGILTLVHYPIPVHLHPAFASLGHRRGAFPNAETACEQVVSLPLYPQLTDGEVERVADAVVAACGP